MSVTTPTPARPPVEYPEDDGLPMSDNTEQFRWIVVLAGNLMALFRAHPDVFVAGNLLWYAVEGDDTVRQAPGVLVAFGRPKGRRGSYRQWEEGGVPVTVVFEIRSPSNSGPRLAEKFVFYEEHGVEEYYLYDPDRDYLEVYVRCGSVLRREWEPDGFISPRLGIRFDLSGEEMTVYHPNGEPFLSFEELMAQRDAERLARLDAERVAGDTERKAARLAELSRKARRGQASQEELAELDRLEAEIAPE